jgi:hypothetical protein
MRSCLTPAMTQRRMDGRSYALSVHVCKLTAMLSLLHWCAGASRMMPNRSLARSSCVSAGQQKQKHQRRQGSEAGVSVLTLLVTDSSSSFSNP